MSKIEDSNQLNPFFRAIISAMIGGTLISAFNFYEVSLTQEPVARLLEKIILLGFPYLVLIFIGKLKVDYLFYTIYFCPPFPVFFHLGRNDSNSISKVTLLFMFALIGLFISRLLLGVYRKYKHTDNSLFVYFFCLIVVAYLSLLTYNQFLLGKTICPNTMKAIKFDANSTYSISYVLFLLFSLIFSIPLSKFSSRV